MSTLPQQNMIEELGLAALPPEMQEEITLKLGTLIYQAILIRALEVMTDEQKTALEKELETKGDDALFPFLQKAVPNFNDIINEQTAKVKQDSVEFLAALRK